MNKQRRKSIYRVIGQLDVVSNEVQSCMTNIKNIKANEKCSYDSIPDNLSESQRAIDSETALDILDDYLDDMQNIIETISNMKDKMYDI